MSTVAYAHVNLDVDTKKLGRAASLLGTARPEETVDAALSAFLELTETVEHLGQLLETATGDRAEYNAALEIFDAKQRD